MRKFLLLLLTAGFLLLAGLVIRKLVGTHQPWHLASAVVGLAIAAGFVAGLLREFSQPRPTP